VRAAGERGSLMMLPTVSTVDSLARPSTEARSAPKLRLFTDISFPRPCYRFCPLKSCAAEGPQRGQRRWYGRRPINAKSCLRRARPSRALLCKRTTKECRGCLDASIGTRTEILRRCQSEKAWGKQLRIPTLQHRLFARLGNDDRVVHNLRRKETIRKDCSHHSAK